MHACTSRVRRVDVIATETTETTETTEPVFFFRVFSRVMTWTTAAVARRDFLGFFYRPRLDRSRGALFSYFTDRDAVCVCVIEKRRPERFRPRSGPRGAEMM
jgi:hypothetical protein